MKRHVKFFDTTLRDGEQAPGFGMNTDEKILLAIQLEKLGIDVIEAGFPVTSPGDFEAVEKVAAVLTKSSVAGLTRAVIKDIAVTWDALKNAVKPRIHIVLSTSDIHLKHKLRKTREEVIAMAVEAVAYAKTLCNDIEFSLEDATRSDREYICKIVEVAIDAGATTINIADTVGYVSPDEFGDLISYIISTVPNIQKADLSVHCHNDLGLAVANSLAAVRAGANQVECTINGIGERAGNAAMEEVIMMMNVRKDLFKDIYTNINTNEIYKTSKLLSKITGITCQPNKAVVGKNAFSHESGIHQDGVLKNPLTYEIMTPESVGFPSNYIILGKHSGRNAFNTRLQELGHSVSASEAERLFKDFKILSDKKKEIFDEDIDALVFSSKEDFSDYKLDYISISSGQPHVPTATVVLIDKDGNSKTDASTGDGPIHAAFKAIDRITGIKGELIDYKINAVTAGKDAQGEVIVGVKFDGNKKLTSRGYSTDVFVASVNAYLRALNRYLISRRMGR